MQTPAETVNMPLEQMIDLYFSPLIRLLDKLPPFDSTKNYKANILQARMWLYMATQEEQAMKRFQEEQMKAQAQAEAAKATDAAEESKVSESPELDHTLPVENPIESPVP